MDWLGGEAARRQFEAFVTDATDSLYRAGYFMTWDAGEAEDLLQETFIRVATHWSRVRSPDRRLAYARRILVNLALDGAAHRSRRRDELDSRTAAPDERSDEFAARALQGIDDASEFRSALPALSRQQRAVLFLRYWEELSESETADLLGCSVGTVKKTTWRAIGRLREQLAPTGSTPRLKAVGPQSDQKRSR